MDLELFRHNHARFIAVNPINPQFLASKANNFDFTKFKNDVQFYWRKMNGRNKNFPMVLFYSNNV